MEYSQVLLKRQVFAFKKKLWAEKFDGSRLKISKMIKTIFQIKNKVKIS